MPTDNSKDQNHINSYNNIDNSNRNFKLFEIEQNRDRDGNINKEKLPIIQNKCRNLEHKYTKLIFIKHQKVVYNFKNKIDELEGELKNEKILRENGENENKILENENKILENKNKRLENENKAIEKGIEKRIKEEKINSLKLKEFNKEKETLEIERLIRKQIEQIPKEKSIPPNNNNKSVVAGENIGGKKVLLKIETKLDNFKENYTELSKEFKKLILKVDQIMNFNSNLNKVNRNHSNSVNTPNNVVRKIDDLEKEKKVIQNKFDILEKENKKLKMTFDSKKLNSVDKDRNKDRDRDTIILLNDKIKTLEDNILKLNNENKKIKKLNTGSKFLNIDNILPETTMIKTNPYEKSLYGSTKSINTKNTTGSKGSENKKDGIKKRKNNSNLVNVKGLIKKDIKTSYFQDMSFNNDSASFYKKK